MMYEDTTTNAYIYRHMYEHIYTTMSSNQVQCDVCKLFYSKQNRNVHMKSKKHMDCVEYDIMPVPKSKNITMERNAHVECGMCGITYSHRNKCVHMMSKRHRDIVALKAPPLDLESGIE